MDNNVITESFLQRLRAATAPAHEALENLPLSKKSIHPTVTVEDYALYLQQMYGVVNDAEQNLYPLVSGIIPDIEERRRLALIAEDLSFLGKLLFDNSKPLTGGISAVHEAFALGVLYVLEGSTLGGRVILKNIGDALGYGPCNGGSYFAGYGGKTGSRWKAFLDDFAKYADSCGCEDDILAGANHAFNAIKEHLG